jgi:hypothetical protein
MAEGRRRDEWNRASFLLALIANCNRHPKAKRGPFKPSEFDPFRLEEEEEPDGQRVTGKMAWNVMQKVFRGALRVEDLPESVRR